MAKPKIKTEDFHLTMTESEKNELFLRAKKAGKSLSQYLIDTGLQTNIDTAKAEFYTSINDDLLYLKRMNYVLSKLLMLSLDYQYNDQEGVKEFYKKALNESEEIFK